ncbi:MAG TPA: HAMP domain-containing sensor histidine kinase [Steroidobacteraceae bacterium]|jgi:signal transduction histidine kinase|nr:HAMP domain-containing sensor histidine kinase [Steroidobacteraceae bacterium]
MADTHSAETATQTDVQLFLSEFDFDDAVQCRDNEPMALLLHELRSPLAAIQNAIAVLRLRGNEDPLRQRMHELIERQVRQIALLTSSPCRMVGPRLESLPLQRERVDLRAVLSSAIETAGPQFTEQQIQLVVSVPQSSIWVLGDANRLEQVFVNLLSNASKYSEAGGQITVSMLADDGHAVVQVRDCGVGIAAASLPFIFGLFVRADSAAVQSRSGLGIGLALVRSIVESHGGTVSAASEGIGRGSEFTLRLKIQT